MVMTGINFYLGTSPAVSFKPVWAVGDPRHFGTGPDPRIHTSDYRIQLRIREAQKHIYILDPDADSEHWYILHRSSKIKSHNEFTKQ